MTASTQRYINSLHPEIQAKVIAGVNECNRRLTGRAQMIITFGWRSIAEQNGLYALGRTKVNPDGKSAQRPFGYKVTNARGGESKHNYGLAFDMALLIDGKTTSWNDTADYDGDKVADWMECVEVFEGLGFSWGGRWSSFIDKPHFEMNFGLTLAQMQARQASKDFERGTTFIRVDGSLRRELITTSGVNFRTGAGTQYPAIRVIPAGTKVIELMRAGGWSQVDVGNQTGWISSSYLK